MSISTVWRGGVPPQRVGATLIDAQEREGVRMYLENGRVNQKLRTREALLEAAAELIRERKTFTVAEAADLAKVGRTTAYRYFPTSEMLRAHAALWVVTNAERSQFGQALGETESVQERLNWVVQTSDRSTSEHDAEYRTMLRMSLQDDEGIPDLPRRTGLRAAMIADALSGLKSDLPDEDFRKLCAAVSLFIGIEGTIVLRDVCHLSPSDALAVKLWAVRALLQTAIQEAIKPKIAARAPATPANSPPQGRRDGPTQRSKAKKR